VFFEMHDTRCTIEEGSFDARNKKLETRLKKEASFNQPKSRLSG